MGSKAKTASSPEPTQILRSMESQHGRGWRVHPSHHQGSGLSSLPQRPEDQGISLQTPPVEELPGRNLNEDTSPTRLDAAGGGIGPVFHHPCPQPPLSRQSCITRRRLLPPPHTQRRTALLEWQISGYLSANNPSGSPSARPCKQAPFPVSGTLSEGQDGLQTPATADWLITPSAARSGAVCKRSL